MGLTQKLGTIPLAIFTDASNNIGIGGSPSGSFKLDVTGTGRFTSGITGANLSLSDTVAITLSATDSRVLGGSSTGRLLLANSGTSTYGIFYGASHATAPNAISLVTDNTERLRITNTGNVGIGTSSPSVLLDINTGALANNAYNGMRIADDVAHYWFLARKDGSGNRRMAIYNGQNNYPVTLQEGGGGVAIGAVSNYGRTLYVLGGGNTSASNCATFDNSSGTTLLSLRNDGAIFTNAFTYGNTVSGGTRTVYMEGGYYALGGISSIRASKKNIENISNVDWLYQLNPVSFNYRKKDENGNYTDEIYDDLEYGLIAEDTAPIADFLVNYNINEDGTKKMIGIEYMRLITPMLKAIQELNAKVSALENKS